MLQDCIPHKGPAIDHVQVLHVIGYLCYCGRMIRRASDCDDAMALVCSTQPFFPFCQESFLLCVTRSRHCHNDSRSCIVIKELFLELRRILINLDLICQRFRLAQSSTVRIQRFQVPHDKHVIH